MKGKIERGCEQVQMSIVASRQFPFFEQVDLSDPLFNKCEVQLRVRTRVEWEREGVHMCV